MENIVDAAKFESQLRDVHNQLSNLEEVKSCDIKLKSWQPLYICIGENICKRRLKMGLSQTEAAKILKIGRTSLNNMEHGRQRFPIDKLYFIAALLGCTVHDLLPLDIPF
jgi:DNA-binding XRE family transcriptional regulator